MGQLLKYCGNHSLEDLQVTTKSQADYIGLVFAESKRKVNPEEVKQWLTEVTLAPGQKLVGVFVNPTMADIDNVIEYVQLDVIQCHGNESVSFITMIKERYSLPVWKVIHHQEGSIEKMNEYIGFVDGFIIDKKTKSQWGGTGTTFDWAFVPDYIKIAEEYSLPLLIAGGITPENIDDLLAYQPPGIDLASGIEENNRKTSYLIQQLEKRLK